MASYNKQLNVLNLDNYLSQIDKNSDPYTIVKFKCRAANCYMKTGSKKNLMKAINLYNDAHDILSNYRGAQDPRTLNVVLFILKCEKKLEKLATLKKN
jgi:hypothetical protein|tara:strand:- start:2 stop:295 length:294 start_codon:yes stop_codon:yes gene_type:complete